MSESSCRKSSENHVALWGPGKSGCVGWVWGSLNAALGRTVSRHGISDLESSVPRLGCSVRMWDGAKEFACIVNTRFRGAI